MNVLVPLTVTDAMLSSATIAEPAAGEAAWSSATAYTVGQRAILVATHRIYECLVAHTNAIPSANLLGPTPKWLDVGPTSRWAAFDGLNNTTSSNTTSMSYVLRPGFFNAIALYGLTGATYTVTLKDAPGGTVVDTRTGSLIEPVPDWYEWLFSPIQQLSKLVLSGFVPYPDPELTITIAAAASAAVGVGILAIGDLQPLIGGGAEFGGSEFGANAQPVSYSYIKTDDYGVTKIVRRHSATDMTVRVLMPRSYADSALAIVQDVLDVPACWIATDAAGFTGLNVYGLGSGTMSYDSPAHATLNLNVKGFV